MCFFYWTRKKRLMRRLFGTFLGPENLMIFFFGLNAKTKNVQKCFTSTRRVWHGIPWNFCSIVLQFTMQWVFCIFMGSSIVFGWQKHDHLIKHSSRYKFFFHTKSVDFFLISPYTSCFHLWHMSESHTHCETTQFWGMQLPKMMMKNIR